MNSLILNARSFCLVVLAGSVFWVGCETKVADNSVDNEKSQPSANEKDTEEEQGYLEQANEMFRKAKAAGQTTASSTGEWISDTVSGAMQATGNAAQDTGDWVTDAFNSLKDNGMTSANNATEWVQQDIKNMGALQYKVVAKNSETAEETLNELGKERWDCFAVDENSFYLKRRSKSYLRNVPVKDLLKFLPVGGGGGE